MKIIEQPFRRWRDRLAVACCQYDVAIGFYQYIGVIVEARCYRTALAAAGVDALCLGETFGVLLQAFNAEELRTDRLLRRTRGFLPKEMQARDVQDTQPQL